MKRRRFIKIGFLSFISGLIWHCSDDKSSEEEFSSQEFLGSLSTLWSGANLKVLSQAYRETLTQDEVEEKERLARKLTSQSKEETQAKINSDYQNNQTLLLHNWLISETEAQLSLIA